MKRDLTLLYYTANRISYAFQQNVISELPSNVLPDPEMTADECDQLPPIITISHKPMQWGRNIWIGDKPPSIWRVYQNILIGAKAATTPFVACCEDDTLYVPEHFTYRPLPDVFGYNRNRWVITRRLSDDGRSRTAFYYWRERTQMAMCIAPTELLIETLEERFAKFPQEVPDDVAKRAGWGEPGRYERNLGITLRRRVYFHTAEPCVTFNHSASLMGRRQVQDTDIVREDLPPWGNANELWNRIYG